MFEKVSQAAEKLATNVSRRAFLGRVGQGALATAGVVAGMLAFGGEAQAQHSGNCEVTPHRPGGGFNYTGACVAGCKRGSSKVCRGFTYQAFPYCWTKVGPMRCTF